MITLVKFKILLKVIGLNPLGGRENIILRILYCFMLFSFNFMCFMCFIVNIDDNANLAWAALTSLFAFVSLLAVYLHLLISRGSFHLLLDDLQDIVNESMISKFYSFIGRFTVWAKCNFPPRGI